MATASNHLPQQQRRETVEFPPNMPVTIALAYAEPRMIAGRFGERAMFSTSDGRALFLDPEVAGQITALGINVRESFSITRRSSGKKGEPDAWEVARIAGEQPNGTLAVPKLPAALNAPKPPQRAETAARPATLVDEGKALVSAYAEVLNWALTTYEGRVKPDEIQRLLTTAYIQRRHLAGAA